MPDPTVKFALDWLGAHFDVVVALLICVAIAVALVVREIKE